MTVLISVSEIIPSVMFYLKESDSPKTDMMRNLFYGSEWLNFALIAVSTAYLVVSFRNISK